jgi:hypothetical protein
MEMTPDTMISLGTLAFFCAFSFMMIWFVAAAVEAVAGFIRLQRNGSTLAASLLVALLLSYPFWPPELLGSTREISPGASNEPPDVRRSASLIYAGVTAVVWWWFLPTARERGK